MVDNIRMKARSLRVEAPKFEIITDVDHAVLECLILVLLEDLEYGSERAVARKCSPAWVFCASTEMDGPAESVGNSWLVVHGCTGR